MKRKIVTQLCKGLLLTACILSFTLANAKNTQTVFKARYAPLAVTDYLLSIQHITQPTDRTIEFDVYLLDTDPAQDFELSSAQLGILFNLGINSTGTLSVIMNNTGSGLIATLQQFPSTMLVSTLAGYPGQGLVKVSGSSAAIGAGAIILKTGNLINANGTYLSHFTISSTTPWVANTTPNLTFTSNLSTQPLYATRVNEVIANVATQLSVTPGVNAIVNGNPILNAPPTAFAVTGTGSYCQGTGGLAVGLAGSETGVTYTLYNGTTALTPTVAGTGSAISFGNQLAGTYTVQGTNFGGTQVMTGSAIITENPALVSSVAIAPDVNPVCAGNTVTFTATPTNGGSAPTYQWYKGATLVGANSATYSYAPANGDVIKVVMTSNATPCLSGSPATSNAVTMTVNPMIPASVAIASDLNNVCAGTTVTFTATPTNGGTAPTYQWLNGNTVVGTNSATYSYVPANGDVIKVLMTSNATPCLSGSPATSNTVTMTVNSMIPASVSIASDLNNVCAGTTVTFTATPTNGGSAPTYQWYKGATLVGTNSATYAYAPANSDVIKVVMTSNATPCLSGSPATSNAVTMTVNPVITAGVRITSNVSNVCAGTTVTFTATPTNGGTTPAYQWYNGAVAVGTNSATYSYVPVNGDAIKVVMTSNATPCLSGSPVTSNILTTTVNPIVPASVTIAPDANNVCAGTVVVFTATSLGGGTSPTYQWYKGASLVGSNSATYSYAPVNGDVLKVMMTSNSPCASGSPATSATVTMTVNPVFTASVSITASANPVGPGIPVTFTAVPVGGGTLPTYQWYKGATVVGTNLNTFTYTPVNGDVISLIMTSNATCVTGSPATSNTVTMSVSPGTSLDQTKMSIDIYSRNKNIYVNCSQKAKQIYIYNTLGSMVMMENNVTGLKEFYMSTNPNAYYFVKIVTDNNVYTQKVLLK